MFAILYSCGDYRKLGHVNGRTHLFETEQQAKRYIRRHPHYGKLPRRVNGYNESIRVVKFNQRERDTE